MATISRALASGAEQAKELARWEADIRTSALHTARDLAVALYYERDTGSRPFRVGVVLDAGERVWAETPVCFSVDLPSTTLQGGSVPRPRLPEPRLSLARHQPPDRRPPRGRQPPRLEMGTHGRLPSRLTPGREVVALDLDCQSPRVWSGAGVTPLAVAAVYRLHGHCNHRGPRTRADPPANSVMRRHKQPPRARWRSDSLADDKLESEVKKRLHGGPTRTVGELLEVWLSLCKRKCSAPLNRLA